MTDDLIYRQELLDDIEAAKKCGVISSVLAEALTKYVKQKPSIAADPSVRCCDCRYFTAHMEVGMCKRIADKPILPINYDAFCSYGERKEEEK